MRTYETPHLQKMNQAPARAGGAGSIFRGIAVGLGRFVAFLLALVLCLPVILLPLATGVPAPVWILLALAALALLAAPFRVKPVWRGTLLSLGGLLLVAVLAVWASQFFAFTPPITDAAGNVYPNSIATLEKINLNGSEQWVTIRGKDVNKPVLLFLAGGPGGSQLTTAQHALKELEDHFVVVNWEQPGAGKSYNAVERSTLTPERYIEDGYALVQHLTQRFDEEKIYVLGESWGSALGIWLAQRHPEKFHAFIGTGQMVAFLDTDLICYEFALKLAQERGDTKKAALLTQQGPPPYYGDDMVWKTLNYLTDTYTYMNQDPKIIGGFNTIGDLTSPEYGLYDKVAWALGPVYTLNEVYPQLWDIDLREQAPSLDVPVYFLLGRHDVNAPPELTEGYFNLLQAPHRELIYFEQSGHSPWTSEPERFVEVVVTRVLAQTQPGR